MYKTPNVDIVSQEQRGFFTISSLAGDGKTNFLLGTMQKFVHNLPSNHVVLFMYAEYNIHSSQMKHLQEFFKSDKVVTIFMPLRQGSIRSMEQLKDLINEKENWCKQNGKALAGIFFDDFDVWIATYNRFEKSNLTETIYKARQELSSFIYRKPYSMFVTIQKQRKIHEQKIGKSIEVEIFEVINGR